MKREDAETATLEALAWIAAEPERISALMAATGADAAALRERSKEPEFMAFVWDFMLMSDENILEFCAATDRDPNEIALIKAALPGGDDPHWT